jgi:hypothetical protein
MRRIKDHEIAGTDQSIERVLAGLRDTQAPAQMEQRIVAAMHVRMLTAQPSRRAGRWAVVPLWAFGCGVAVAALVVGAVGIRQGHGPAVQSERAAVRHSARPAVEPERVQVATSERSPTPLAQRVANDVLGEVSMPAATVLEDRGRTARTETRPSEADEVALSEMQAPSQPAPPLPLTQQEKWLQRIARAHDPQEMAALNAETRARQDMEAKAEVEKFFEPPPPIAQENE